MIFDRSFKPRYLRFKFFEDKNFPHDPKTEVKTSVENFGQESL
jgi:hypothetical protein